MLPLVITLLLESLVIKEGFQSWWIIILAETQTTFLVPSYKVHGLFLVDITFGPLPGHFSSVDALVNRVYVTLNDVTRKVLVQMFQSVSKSDLPVLICAQKKKKNCHSYVKREKESVLPYLWRNQKHLLFTGLHFHGLVHLVQSCQNRVRKGQQINVREAANLHKSPTPSREIPSCPAGPSNFVTWANGHRNNVEIKKTYFAQIQAFKAASPIPLFH